VEDQDGIADVNDSVFVDIGAKERAAVPRYENSP